VRRLLLVAYHFPPEPAAGALRPGYLARYLPEFGWEVTVLTRPVTGRNGSPRVIEAKILGEKLETSIRGGLGRRERGRSAERPPSLVRRSLRWAKSTFFFPDAAAGWLPGATMAAIRTLRRERFDAVLSTAMPASAHVVAGISASGLPWIADYRDPWSGNRYARCGPARARLELALERALVRRASAITTISPAIAAQLQSLHGRPVTVIPNAGDPEDWRGLEAIRPEAFSLCYTGSLYDGYRTPELLFEAMADLRREGHPAGRAEVHFYGPNSDHVGLLARRFGVTENVVQHGTVARAAALRAQRAASDLLVFLNMDDSTSTELGSKIYEYIGARRPILAFGPRNSVMRSYLADRSLGWFANDIEEAKELLRSAHQRFSAGDFEIDPARGSMFEARDLAKAFAAQLDAVVL
jgi:glycosyltransferase involved in cell wall biosynthesis